MIEGSSVLSSDVEVDCALAQGRRAKRKRIVRIDTGTARQSNITDVGQYRTEQKNKEVAIAILG